MKFIAWFAALSLLTGLLGGCTEEIIVVPECDCTLWESRTMGYNDPPREKFLEDYYVDDCELDNKSVSKYYDRVTGHDVRVYIKCN